MRQEIRIKKFYKDSLLKFLEIEAIFKYVL